MTYWQILLAACGVTVIFTQASLFRFLQARAEFFRCSLCVGTWTGAAVALLAYFTDSVTWREACTLPPATALLSHLAANFVQACWRVGSEPIPEIPSEIPEQPDRTE